METDSGSTLVQQYISSVFKQLDWHEERVSWGGIVSWWRLHEMKTEFTGKTPIGDIDFANLIYTFNPDAPRKIVLSAHFDSKWFDGFPANQASHLPAA